MEAGFGVLIGFMAALMTIGVAALFMSSLFRRLDYLKQKVLREIVAHDELGDGLKDEARFMLEEKRYEVLAADWIKHNEGQFTGELRAMTEEAARLGRVCVVRRWIFIFLLLATMSVAAYAAIGADAFFTFQGISLFSTGGGGWLFTTKYRVWSDWLGISVFVLMYLIWERKYSKESPDEESSEAELFTPFLLLFFLLFAVILPLSGHLVENLDSYINVLVNRIH